MFGVRKVVVILSTVVLAMTLVAAGSDRSNVLTPRALPHAPAMLRRRADAGRPKSGQQIGAERELREMYEEYVAKARREGRAVLSWEEFMLKHAGLAKRAGMHDTPWSWLAPTSRSTATASSSHTHATHSAHGHSSAPAMPSMSPSGGGLVGQATYYEPGLGACGKTSGASDRVVAVSHTMFDKHATSGDANANALCGRKIKASYKGKSTLVTVVDRCVGCSPLDLDFSPAAFADLAATDVGRLSDLKWSFVDE